MSAPASEPVPSASDTYREALSGEDLGRILGFTDGVFGFSMTFLVVNLVIPLQCIGHTGQEGCLTGALWTEGTYFIAYVFSFVVIAIWWVRHHAIFRYFARYDAALLWANLLFCLTIAVTPFILGVFANYTGVEIAVILFAAVEACAGALLLLMWEIGVRAALLKPDATPLVISRMRRRGAIAPAIFLVSAGAAVVSVYIAHFIWAALFVEIIWSQLTATRLLARPPRTTAGSVRS